MNLGDRMKLYEGQEAARFLPRLPVIVRLDGKAFHTFTRSMPKPFFQPLSELMRQTTAFLVEKTNAVIGHTQSDEITLVLYTDKPDSQLMFDGRRDKLNSVLASMCSVFFNRVNLKYSENAMAFFDCRSFVVPNKTEAVNCLIWREQDAYKNAISSTAQYHFSHNQLQGKNGKQMKEMLLKKKKVDFESYPNFIKYGTYIKRRIEQRKFKTEELDNLPENHTAHKDPDLVVTRHVVEPVRMNALASYCNREEFVFEGKELIPNPPKNISYEYGHH